MVGLANKLLGMGDCYLEPCEYSKSHSAGQKGKIGMLWFLILPTSYFVFS